jgi:hypothetical protein
MWNLEHFDDLIGEQIGQSRPDSELGFQVKVLENL